MIPELHRRITLKAAPLWSDARAAQLAEFAIALPLLVFFVVGIFDFSSAFTLKQKLTNIARDAARTAAGDPSNDLQFPSVAGGPASVLDAFQLIDNYLQANKLNDCGITTGAAPTGLTWTFSAKNSGCVPPGLTIIINRGYFFPASGTANPSATCVSQGTGGTALMVIATCVSIQYAYPWRFGRIANVLGNTEILPNQITATAVALNEN